MAFDLNETNQQDDQKLQIPGNLSLQHEGGTAATDPNNPPSLNIDATYALRTTCQSCGPK